MIIFARQHIFIPPIFNTFTHPCPPVFLSLIHISPGIGFALVVAILGAVLYFAPLYIEGVAQNWELILFIIGLALLAVEIFVLPGFGIAGVAGIIAVVTDVYKRQVGVQVMFTSSAFFAIFL